MRICLFMLALFSLASIASAAAGEIIGSTFQLPGASPGTVRGLDKDWADGNI